MLDQVAGTQCTEKALDPHLRETSAPATSTAMRNTLPQTLARTYTHTAAFTAAAATTDYPLNRAAAIVTMTSLIATPVGC